MQRPRGDGERSVVERRRRVGPLGRELDADARRRDGQFAARRVRSCAGVEGGREASADCGRLRADACVLGMRGEGTGGDFATTVRRTLGGLRGSCAAAEAAEAI